MKVRNKETGQIETVEFIKSVGGKIFESVDEMGGSLAKICEAWEDVPEESKTHWMIDTSVLEPVREIAGNPYEIDKEIGNWFNTKEEAELALRKLKAWKRLKEKGFRFRWIDMQTGQIKYGFFLKKGQKFARGDEDNLMLLFGGEE